MDKILRGILQKGLMNSPGDPQARMWEQVAIAMSPLAPGFRNISAMAQLYKRLALDADEFKESGFHDMNWLDSIRENTYGYDTLYNNARHSLN
ncbi:hypothetical protein PG994_000736 [Apiospora phragmitis]|uniref:Uncharacterized protein n=1 Tax=Apiospora phragmitis TaxID=2905665 RepID=A0ABR1X775_9PEZI